MTVYIDNEARKRIVTFWIPVCLWFLHGWGTIFACSLSAAIFILTVHKEAIDAVAEALHVVGWTIFGLILLLISDKGLEFIISRVTGSAPTLPQTVKTTKTEETVVTPAAPVAPATIPAQDVNIKAEGDINVGNN